MVQLIYYPSKMYMDCRVLFYILEKVIMEFETFFHISIYQSSLSQVYTCISAKIAERRSLFIFSSIVCWQLLMTPRHFLVYRVSWPLHSFCSHKKTFSGTETERDLRDERSSYRCLRSLLRYMAPLNPTLMAATASQRDLSQKIASRIGFSSTTIISYVNRKLDLWVVCTISEFLNESKIVE